MTSAFWQRPGNQRLIAAIAAAWAPERQPVQQLGKNDQNQRFGPQPIAIKRDGGSCKQGRMRRNLNRRISFCHRYEHDDFGQYTQRPQGADHGIPIAIGRR